MKKLLFLFLLVCSLVCYAQTGDTLKPLPFTLECGNIFTKCKVSSYASQKGVYFRFDTNRSLTKIEVHYKNIGSGMDSVVTFVSNRAQLVSQYYLKAMAENCLGVYVDGVNCKHGKKFSEFAKNVYEIYLPIQEKKDLAKAEIKNKERICLSTVSALRDSIRCVKAQVKVLEDSAKFYENYFVDQYIAENQRIKDSLTTLVKDYNAEQLGDYMLERSEYMSKHGKAIEKVFSVIGGVAFCLGECNYVGGHDFDLAFTNNSKKTIKYFTVDVTFKNLVGDLCSDRHTGKATKTLEGIGPIKSGEDEYAHWDAVIYDNWASTAIINKFKIEYVDGSTVTINGKDIMALCNIPEKPELLDVEDSVEKIFKRTHSSRYLTLYSIEAAVREYPIFERLENERRALIDKEGEYERRISRLKTQYERDCAAYKAKYEPLLGNYTVSYMGAGN